MTPLLAEIESRYIPVTESGCWLWLGSTWQSGYGQWRIDGKLKRAHRVVYEALVGPIPDGLEPDHLCRVHCCGNPYHLELVTSKVNTLRGVGPTAQNAKRTHCIKGHPFSGDNLYIAPDGKRGCWTCMRSKDKDRRPARREYWRKYWHVREARRKERVAQRLLAGLKG